MVRRVGLGIAALGGHDDKPFASRERVVGNARYAGGNLRHLQRRALRKGLVANSLTSVWNTMIHAAFLAILFLNNLCSIGFYLCSVLEISIRKPQARGRKPPPVFSL